MLTLQIQPFDADEPQLHPFAPLAVSLTGNLGKVENGDLSLGVSDLTGFVSGFVRFISEPQTKKHIFDTPDSRLQIICERHKHAMIAVRANGQVIEFIEDRHVISAFKSGLSRFYASYRSRMLNADSSFDQDLPEILDEFDRAYEAFMTMG